MGEIYLITNNITNRRYVGKTKYTAQQRWLGHIQDSKRNRSNSYLHRAINKYGVDVFSVKTLIKNVPEDELNKLEVICIKRLNTLVPYGYNLCRGGSGVSGYRHTEKTKHKIGVHFKGKKRSVSDIQKIKEGHRRNNSYERRSKNINWRQNISKSRKGKYCKEDNPFYGKRHTESTKKSISEHNSKAVLMCDLDGNIINRFDNLKLAREFLNNNNITNNKTCDTLISRACRGKLGCKTAYGYIWKYEKV